MRHRLLVVELLADDLQGLHGCLADNCLVLSCEVLEQGHQTVCVLRPTHTWHQLPYLLSESHHDFILFRFRLQQVREQFLSRTGIT